MKINFLGKKRHIFRWQFLFVILLFFIICPTIGKSVVIQTSAEYSSQTSGQEDDEYLQEFEEQIDKQLQELDFSSLEDILQSLSDGQIKIFGGTSFLAKLQKLIAGEFDREGSIWSAIIEIFFDNFIGLLPIISIIVAIALLGNMLQGLKPSNGKSISNIVNFVTYGIIVVLVLSMVVRMVTLTSSTIISIKNQMDAVFPVLLTLLTAVGGTVSSSVYQPAMALLSSIIMNFFTYILLPIFIFSVVFNVVSNLSNTVKLDKFSSFLNSTYKWLIGLIFTIFTAFLSIQGITASSVDGISLRTAKYAIRSYVPILGSYLSDGMGIILASSNLIKNAVGATGLFLLLATLISPLLELIIFMLALKLIAGIVEPLGNKQVANFVSSLSKSMVLLIVLLIGVAFVYFITIGLIMCSANII